MHSALPVDYREDWQWHLGEKKENRAVKGFFLHLVQLCEGLQDQGGARRVS